VAEAPDKKEREEALDPARSFIVQAPAGSGKTTLLIQRYLRLLAVVKRPEEILAVTFTKKAAGEMHTRIVEALLKAASGDEAGDECEAATMELALRALERDSIEGWSVLENPGRLRVQTIDSFSAALARQMPLLSRLGTESAVAERPGPLYEEAVRRTLAVMDNDDTLSPSIMQLLRYNDNFAANLEKKLVVMLSKRDQWIRHIPDEATAREDLEASLARLAEEGLNRAVEAFPDSLADCLTASARYAALHVGEFNPIAKLRDLRSLPPATADNLGLWKSIAVLLITGTGSWRKPGGVNIRLGFPRDKTDEALEAKNGFKDLLAALAINDELLHSLTDVLRLPGPRYKEEDWKTLRALLRLLPVARRRLIDVFREEGALDFPAISLAAIEALGPDERPTDLMLLLDNTYSHILVDEYQDTSWTQVNLLKALTRGWEDVDGRTLFLVGDPMQSIYRFRDADVGLFLRAIYEGLGGLKPCYLRLKSNFRSEGHLVKWVNETFSLLFPTWPDLTTGAVPYGEASAVKGPAEEARVNITLYSGRDDAQEAADVLNIIAKINPSESTAILARSRSHLEVIVERLKEAGIDFVAKALESLGERPVILDLLALSRALIDPADRVAWLAALRAGWCGLTLADLHAICLGNGEAPIWELIHDKNRLEGLSAEGLRRLLAFRETMGRVMGLRGREGARSLMEGLWTALGGGALYDDADSMREAERFFEIVEAAEAGGAALTAKELEARVEGLYAAGSASTDNPVQVMTMHGAKGLEFDHVILPGLGRRTGKTDKEILYWMEKGDDLILAPMEKKGTREANLVYQYLNDIYKERDELERTRLFYVAATRAKKELYLLGHIKESDNGIEADSRSFLGLVEDVLNKSMVAKAAEGDEGAEGRPDGPCLKRLSPAWTPPEPSSPCAPVATAPLNAAADMDRPVFDWAGAEARHNGTVIHRYLYRIAREGVSRWQPGRIAAEEGTMTAMLRGLGLNRDKAGEGAKRCVEIISRALNDEKGAWILGPHRDEAAEYALTGPVDKEIKSVIIDRTFVDDKGIRWVIDYKTGEHRGGELRVFLENEKKRYKAQLEGYAELLERWNKGKTIKKALYYPAIPAWIEW